MKKTESSILNNMSAKPAVDQHTLRYMIDSSLDIICTINGDGEFSFVSKSCFSILGYNPEELLGEEYIKYVYPDDVPRTEKAAQDIKQGKYMTNFENRYLHKTGHTIPILWSAKWDDHTKLMYCVAKDASEIKKLETENELERKNKEALINITDTLIWSFDKNLYLISANEAFINSVFDFTGKHIQKGQNLMDESFFSADHISFWRKPYRDVMSGKSTQIELEVPTTSQNETMWLKTEIKPIKEGNRNLGGVCRTIDITKSKRNEIKVRDLNEKLNEAQSFAKLGYWELNLDDQTFFWSDEIYKIWELERESFRPSFTAVLKTIHPDDVTYYKQRHQNAIKHIEPLNNFFYRIISASGKIKWIREIGDVVKEHENSGKEKLKGIVQDVSHQKEVELELKQRNLFIESIFQNIPMGIAVNKIKEGTAIIMNNEFSNVYGWPKAALTDVSTFFSKIYPDSKHHKQMVTRVTDDMNSGDIKRMQWKDISITTQNGLNKYVDAKNIPLPDQNLMISTVTDVTDKVKSKLAMEKALLERNIVLESISDAFYALNEKNEFTYLNQTALSIFNKKDENLLGKNLFAEFPELKNTVFNEYLQDVKQVNEARSFEFYYQKSGKWYDENIYPTKEGFSVFFKDITDRKLINKELQSAYEKNQEILESISDAFYALDKDFNFTYFNTEAEKLLKISKDEALGKNVWQLFKPAVKTKLYDEYLKAVELRKTRSFEFYYSNLKTWFQINAYPSENGLSVYFRNITDQKRNGKELKKLNKELIDRANELEQINTELEQFAFIASHDLQEPLRMITSFMSLLKNKYGSELDEKAHTYMNFAIDGGLKMRQIIIDLLEYSRAGSDLNHTEEIDLNKVVDEVISLHRGVIYHKNAEITIEKLPTIHFNKIGISQVLQNLITNALKYCKESSIPKIKISCLEFKEEFQISVRDNGIGIKKDYHNKIFVIFQRLHLQNQYSGTGIGLAICKKIIEKGKGKIWVESELNKYSCFHFTIPKQ